MSRRVRHVLVLADSLAFHGPDGPQPPGDPRLYPNVLAASLAGPGDEVRADVVARIGWTARDAWWALTKDPRVWGELVPRADAVVLGVGGMDALPASVPTFLREGIPYVRPGSLRRGVRRAYAATSPRVIRLLDGRVRQLPQAATDHYLRRVVEGIAHYRPGLPSVLLGPSPYAAATYPSDRGHAPAAAAARRWAAAHGTGLVDPDPLVLPALRDGSANPDGLHWAWSTHEAVGRALAAELRRCGWA
ncbi:MAG: SGNH/GDSL hydrolase family protein [Frankiales bacterium]|nr:SGNH/GDSL hydrolase family protein [Frankiales bacterium]